LLSGVGRYPSRESLAALADAIRLVRPSAILLLVRPLDELRLHVLHSSALGVGAYTVTADQVPDPLQRATPGITRLNAIASDPERPVEWQAAFTGARQLISVPMAHAPASRLWIGFADDGPPTADEVSRLQAAIAGAASLLGTPASEEYERQRLQRLELTAGLLPALTQVLDVRDVFDQLSEFSKQALPHDLLTLGLFNDDLTRVTMHARTGTEADVGGTFPQPYPPAVARAWEFDIADDRINHPIERDRRPTQLGGRSSVRVPLRLGDRLIGVLGFMSFEAHKYATADVEIARRLADFVTVALAHQRLAEQARHNDELRARAANLALLDDLLTSLIDTGDLRLAFERISTSVQKILPHDGATLPIILPDGEHARVYASIGVDPPWPEIVDVPPELMRNPSWEDEIVEDLPAHPEPRNRGSIKSGFLSLMRVPVRQEGRFAGTVIFLSRKRSAFSSHDLLVARRIADRLALLVARDREIEASNRADEASTRAVALESRVKELTEELDARTGYRRVVGESPEWRKVLTQATQVAPNETTVLLLGESGTGKEVVARFVHRASPRAKGPFIALNCAALPEQLLEAELFGYERGAYTGAVQSKPGQLEHAAGGTLFLDEVGEMSLPVQAKFLRVLQEREFQRLGGTRVFRTDARIVAATNRDLERAIKQNLFREDLYYRLNVFAIYLPALRDRPADVLPLSEAFLTEIGRSIARPAAGISRDARARLLGYHWPGNVRELRNILERASILCDGGLITPEHLAIGPGLRPAAATQAAPAPEETGIARERSPGGVSSAEELKSLERDMIEQALQRVRFNKSKAAKNLGLTRQQLYLRMKKYGLE
jgi:two-component system response regulator FlrC